MFMLGTELADRGLTLSTVTPPTLGEAALTTLVQSLNFSVARISSCRLPGSCAE